MTKKSTKKVKAALKKMPMMKTSDGFMERLDEKITEILIMKVMYMLVMDSGLNLEHGQFGQHYYGLYYLCLYG